MTGSTGNDILDGGAGQDTAIYKGNAGDYRFGWSNGQLTVTDLNVADGDEGTDYLRNIERLQFADRTLSVKPGGESRVSTLTPIIQDSISITGLADGGWVVSLVSTDPNNGNDILVQRYSAAGQRLGDEITVSPSQSNQAYSDVTGLADGGWVVTWGSYGEDGDTGGIYARRFNVQGEAVGGQWRVNTHTLDSQDSPAVTALDDGGWVIVWMSRDANGNNFTIESQRYNAAGAAVGGETQVNTTTGDNQLVHYSADVTGLKDGGWLVTWHANHPGESRFDIYAQRYDATGNRVGSETQVNTNTLNVQYIPVVTALNDGGWLVSWSSSSADNGDDIYFQRYNAMGEAVGGETLVINNPQYVTQSQSFSDVTALADGGWVVTWESGGEQDGSGIAIYAQRYNAAGQTVGGETLVNTITDGSQVSAKVTSLQDGGWAVTWVSIGQSSNQYDGVYVQRFTAEGAKVLLEVTGTSGNDILNGKDKMVLAGGTGNDTYKVIDNLVQLREETGAGTDTVSSTVSWVLGANLENLVLTGSSAINGTGNTQANTLTGNSAANTLAGGAGNDILIGGAGNDTLNGGSGADKMTGGDGSDLYYVDNVGDVVSETNAVASTGGTDRVYSYLSAYTLGANVENLRLMSTGTANGTGNSLNNVIYAGAGNNVLDGGAGIDTLSYAYATAAVTANLGLTTAQATGGSGSDTLLNFEHLAGSSYNDILTGNSAANTLSGGAGNDTLNGAGGADRMIGGDGSDLYYVDNVGDVVSETNAVASTGGTDRVYSSLSAYTLGANVENLRLLATGAANGTGNSLDNVIYAGAGNNILDGGAGIDTLSYAYATAAVTANLGLTTAQATGGSGSDTLLNFENLTGSSYNDILTGNSTANILSGGAGNDSLNGAGGADRMIGGDGSDLYYVDDTGDVVSETNAVAKTGGTDRVFSYLDAYTLGANVENLRLLATGTANGTGNSLNNVIEAGAGNNILNGGAGIDTLSYAYATAAVAANLGLTTAQATGGSGSDTLLNFENLTGSSYNDILTGNSAANTLNGGAGNDTLNGGAGNDLLIGGKGLDKLYGGTGADIFDFNALNEMGLGAALRDVIGDFKTSEGDKIDLSTLDANLATAANDAFSFIGSSAFSSDATGQLRFAGGILYGSTDADTAAEFEIQLIGVSNLQTIDLIA